MLKLEENDGSRAPKISAPKTSDDAHPEWIGLEGAKRLLQSLYPASSPTQSVLFYGAEGCGSEKIAIELARSWLCLNPISSDSANLNNGQEAQTESTPSQSTQPGPCGVCDSCESFRRGNHPDFLMIEPMPPSRIIRLNAITITGKSGDDQGSQPPIQAYFSRAPIRGRAKVVLIKDVDRMNEAAANAFLKTLEEPPAYAKIVMTSSRFGGILATIVSRCVCVACELPHLNDLEKEIGSIADWERALSDCVPELIMRIRKNPEIYERIYNFAHHLHERKHFEALYLADQFRALVKDFEKVVQSGTKPGESMAGRAREAQALSLSLLAKGMRHSHPQGLKC